MNAFERQRSKLLVASFVILVLAATASTAVQAGKPAPPPPPTPPPPVHYEVLWLAPILPANAFTALNDINDSLLAVGTEGFSGTSTTYRALIVDVALGAPLLAEYLQDKVTNLPTAWSLETASCITNDGLVAGRYRTTAGVGVYVCDTNSGTVVPVVRPEDLFAWVNGMDMNERGDVLIQYGPGGGPPWLYAVGVRQADRSYQLRFLDGEIPGLAEATGINTAGQVVGRLDSGAGFVYSLADGSLRTFQTTTSAGVRSRINDAGIVAHTNLKRKDYAARYDTNTSKNEFLTTTRPSLSRAINNGGQICGSLESTVRDKPNTGFIYVNNSDPTKRFWSLNDLVDPQDPIWFSGDSWVDSCVPNALNDLLLTGFPFIVGAKGSMSLGFVLVPMSQ
jgi:hypothetical protein